MSETLTPSALRKDLYRVLDRVLETGEPQPISRRGETLFLVAQRPERNFRIGEGPRHPEVFEGTLEELAAVSWEHLWDPDAGSGR
jgi:hypothetical protein